MRKLLLAATAILASTAAAKANAQDWSGFYVGGAVGSASGDVTWNDVDCDWTCGTVHGEEEEATSVSLDAGYNWQFSNWVFGVQGDVTAADLSSHDRFNPFGVPRINLDDDFNYIVSARANAGYSFGAILPYATFGVSWSDLEHSWNEDFDPADSWPSIENSRGIVYGGGVKYAMTPNWVLGAEGLHYDFGTESKLNGLGYQMDVNTTVDVWQITLNYQFR